MADQLAVMRGVGYGRWGMHRPGLFFETWLPDNSATLQLLFGNEAEKVMAQAGIGVSNVGMLEGRSCHVQVDGHHVTFKGMVPVSQASPGHGEPQAGR